MKKNTKDLILSADKIRLTQDQKNLIELAFVSQILPEDAKFIEKVLKEAKKGKKDTDPFAKLSGYYTEKYGDEFGMLYLSAILGGEEKYKETVASIKKIKSKKG